MIIYVLNWIHRYVENETVVCDTTFMGTYTSEENVKKAIEVYKTYETYVPYCDDKVEEWGDFEIEESTPDRIFDSLVLDDIEPEIRG